MPSAFHRTQRLPALLFALVLWSGGGGRVSAGQPAPDPAAGEAAYAKSCARCHGAAGGGDGLDARRFYPRPRDLTLGTYKFRSTVSGTPPTDADLFRSITHGLPGSNMPDWEHVDEETRWQVVYYLKSLSSFFEEVAPEPVAVAEDPGRKGADLAKGRERYDTLGCAACHGEAGRANGPSAAGLVDDWGMPIRSANLTQGWNYRGGSDPRSVMLRFLTGIDGAGMPSYAEVISPEEAWHLAYYVASLQEPVQWNMIAHPSRVEGALPATLEDPRWAAAEQTDLWLRNAVTVDGEWATRPTVTAVSLRAVHNHDGIAFRFAWDDPTLDPSASQGEPEQGVEAGVRPDGFALLLKPSGSHGDVVTLQAWPYTGAPELDLCYWSADTGSAAEELAEEFDSVMARTGSPVPLTSASGYEDGRWQLVLQRPLQPVAPDGAAVIEPDRSTSIAVAVWDGGNPEARAVSPWVELALPRDHAAAH